jgi:hypothetical protein
MFSILSPKYKCKLKSKRRIIFRMGTPRLNTLFRKKVEGYMHEEAALERSVENKLATYPGAQKAWEKLVEKGVDRGTLTLLLKAYLFSGYHNAPPLWLPPRRTRKKIQSAMEDLAARTEYLFLYPGISAELAGVALSDDASLNSAIVAGLPKILRNYGRFIGTLPPGPSQKRGASHKNRLLRSLIDYIKLVTGQPHYAFIAILLNACDSAGADFEMTRSGRLRARKTMCHDPRWDPLVLAQLVYREKVGKKKRP